MLKTIAALLAATMLTAPAIAAEPIYDWSGAYIGLGISGVAVGGAATTDLPEVPEAAYTLDGEPAPQLGISAGYNWMLNDFLLLGVQADTGLTLPTDPTTPY